MSNFLKIPDPKWVSELVKNAFAEANKDNSGKPDYSSEGHCLNAVENVLEKTLGIQAKRPASACQFPAFYKNYKDFLKYFTKADNSNELYKLPLGSIIVWGKTEGHPHGHIEIKIANPSRFASDYIQLTRVSYAGNTIPLAIYIPK